jgi:hypothetical protein
MLEGDGNDDKPKRSVAIAIVGAIGGGLLTFSGQVAFEAYKDWRAETKQLESTQQAQDRERRDRVSRLIAAYDALDDLPRRAQAYIDDGSEGSVSDVRDVARHFRKTISETVLENVRKEDVAKYYGGRLYGWGNRFSQIGNGSSPTSKNFGNIERNNFRLLGAALIDIADTVPLPEPSAAADALTNYWSDSNAVADMNVAVDVPPP